MGGRVAPPGRAGTPDLAGRRGEAATYPTGEKISDKDMRQLEKTRITGHDWHPDWNYTSHAADKPDN